MAQPNDHARRVLDLARAEADRFGHRYLGPEHVLVGLVAEGHSGAENCFASSDSGLSWAT